MIKNCFIITTDSKNLNKRSREWPSSKGEAILAIRESYLFDSLESFFEVNDFSEIVVKSVTDWSFSEFVCSALSFIFLDENKSAEDKYVQDNSPYGWCLITQLLMNQYLSYDILLFLKNNSFYDKGRKKDIIKGVNFCFKLGNLWFGNEKCIRNVLIFLEIDKDDIESLLKDFSFKKSLEPIQSYILSLTKELD